MSWLLSKGKDAFQWLEGTTEPVVKMVMDKTGMSELKAKVGLGALTIGSGILVMKCIAGSNNKMPPGPKPLPIIGNLKLIASDPSLHLVLDKLWKQYGDIYTIHLGPMTMVVLTDPELLKEAYIRHGKTTSNRPYQVIFDIFSDGGQDIAAANYSPRLQIQRKLAHQALRKFAVEGAIEKYLHSAFNALSIELDKTNELVGTEMGFLVAYNIIVSMCFGKTFKFDDPFFSEMIQLTKESDERFKDIGMLDSFRIGKYIPNAAYTFARHFVKTFHGYLDKVMDDHIETFDEAKLNDFTDHLIKVMKDAEKNPEDKTDIKLLNKTHYVHMLSDLFFAGTDTTRMTLNWIWHYLAAFPEVQKKAQQEIDDVLGRDGQVTSSCRTKLPYVDAFLHEVLRIKPVAAFGLFHETSEDMSLGGYTIPKGTALTCNTWSIHKDPRHWENPEAFLPERWLMEDGSYLYQQKGFVPFSLGTRSCIGESFVKVELHLLTTMLLQKYTLEPKPGFRVSVEAKPGIIIMPEDQQPIVVKRRM